MSDFTLRVYIGPQSQSSADINSTASFIGLIAAPYEGTELRAVSDLGTQWSNHM